MKNIKRYLQQEGGLFPHLTVFADSLEEKKPAIVHIPIPDKYINSEFGKDTFIDKVVPELAEEMKKRFNVVGVAWASEGWMRTQSSKEKIDPNSPIKTEVLIITFEDAEKEEVTIYELKRLGMQVNESGDMTDTVELIEIPELGNGEGKHAGRFTGLFKKFKK